MKRVAAQRAAVQPRVLLTRPVARVARDAELCRARVSDLHLNWLDRRLTRLRLRSDVELGPAVSGVTADADAVPVARLRKPCPAMLVAAVRRLSLVQVTEGQPEAAARLLQ